MRLMRVLCVSCWLHVHFFTRGGACDEQPLADAAGARERPRTTPSFQSPRAKRLIARDTLREEWMRCS